MLSSENKIELHQDLLNKMHDLYVSKNDDYGDSVHDTYEKFGMTSFLVRMSDKLNRATALSKKDSIKVTDEKLEDTLLDLANYALLAIIELENDRSNLVSECKEPNEDYPYTTGGELGVRKHTTKEVSVKEAIEKIKKEGYYDFEGMR